VQTRKPQPLTKVSWVKLPSTIGDLLHYAGAPFLNAEYLASWNIEGFNRRIEKSINKVNKKINLKTIKVARQP